MGLLIYHRSQANVGNMPYMDLMGDMNRVRVFFTCHEEFHWISNTVVTLKHRNQSVEARSTHSETETAQEERNTLLSLTTKRHQSKRRQIFKSQAGIMETPHHPQIQRRRHLTI